MDKQFAQPVPVYESIGHFLVICKQGKGIGFLRLGNGKLFLSEPTTVKNINSLDYCCKKGVELYQVEFHRTVQRSR